MKDFRNFFADILAKRPHDAEGNPLCDCGARVRDEEFTCAACRAAAELQKRKEEAERSRQFFLARLERGVRTAPNWPHARLGLPEFTAAVPGKKLRAIAEKWTPAAGNLVLSGPSGCGKTTAAIALLWRLRDEAMAEARSIKSEAPTRMISKAFWVQSYDLARARKEHPLGQGEAPEVERAFDASLLVLDDLGNEPPDGVIFEVIDARYRAERPLIVTTGLNAPGIRERYGDALWRRLAERGALVGVEAPARER